MKTQRKLNILSVAFPFAPVRTDTAGGAEHVLEMIDEALMEAGHNSIVIACEGSKVKGKLIKTQGVHGSIDPGTTELFEKEHLEAIEHALRSNEVDLIHMHGIDFAQYIPKTTVPILVTLHLPLSWYPQDKLTNPPKGVYFNCVSRSQFQSRPEMPSLLGFIGNGIRLEKFQVKTGKHNFALSLGRICWDKGYHAALDASKKAGIPLIIAGELFPYEYHREYYNKEILPRLDGIDYKFIGPVGLEKKKRLLSAARCLLVPSLVPETSSLVAMEALACGTPVIAYPAGALCEIIDDGVTGFIVNSIDEMAGAILRSGEIKAEVCRSAARKRFSSGRTIKEYFRLYENIISEDGTSPFRKISKRRIPNG
ncbi:MAG TPA: glycosyltransferase family 4 protein [Ignavibacteriales bacterium]|nr:glycosyltransferase family 4 protein [Ignavibacteriales bacterium]